LVNPWFGVLIPQHDPEYPSQLVNELSSKSALKQAAGWANVKNERQIEIELRSNLKEFIGAF
jgi:hypothetical protein